MSLRCRIFGHRWCKTSTSYLGRPLADYESCERCDETVQTGWYNPPPPEPWTIDRIERELRGGLARGGPVDADGGGPIAPIDRNCSYLPSGHPGFGLMAALNAEPIRPLDAWTMD